VSRPFGVSCRACWVAPPLSLSHRIDAGGGSRRPCSTIGGARAYGRRDCWAAYGATVIAASGFVVSLWTVWPQRRRDLRSRILFRKHRDHLVLNRAVCVLTVHGVRDSWSCTGARRRRGNFAGPSAGFPVEPVIGRNCDAPDIGAWSGSGVVIRFARAPTLRATVGAQIWGRLLLHATEIAQFGRPPRRRAFAFSAD